MEDRRCKDGRGKREEGSNCLKPFGKKREERREKRDKTTVMRMVHYLKRGRTGRTKSIG
jgi:hypothetical protein